MVHPGLTPLKESKLKQGGSGEIDLSREFQSLSLEAIDFLTAIIAMKSGAAV